MNTMEKAIEVGRFLLDDPVGTVRTGQTPHTIIHRQNKASVRYFAPVEAKFAPVFVSMPLINTWTIFDLLPGRSVIEALVKAGVPVYVLDWGRPGPEDAAVTVENLVDGLLHRALDRARRHAALQQGVSPDAVTMDAIGYCVGGTFLSVYLARHPNAVRRVAFIATPIDFHASGRLCTWANPAHFPVDEIASKDRNFGASRMRESFAWLRPSGQPAKWRSLWERFDSPGFVELWSAMEQWNGDNVDFPGAAYAEYVRQCYFNNALMKGGWTLGTSPVNFKQAKIPALALAASEDHIVPPAAAFGLAEAWGGPVTTKVISGGHVGVCVGKQLPAAFLEWVKG